jgi:cystathionine beta-synthase
MTRSDVGKGHPQYYQDMAERITSETPNSFYVNQFNNPANPLAHEQTTGPEIWEQTEHKLDAVVCGVGSGGTITGLSHYFARVAPNVEMVLADPVGSVLAEYIRTGKVGTAGSWFVEGIGEDFVPPVSDLSRVKKAYSISDAEAMNTVHKLLSGEGVLAGSSTGTLVAAALKYCRDQSQPKTVVTFVCDTGNKYLSKAFNENWLEDQGLSERPQKGDLRDLISRPATTGSVVSVGPDDPLTVAYSRMRLYDVSQLPVLDETGRLAGIVDESDLLFAAHHGNNPGDHVTAFDRPVREVMTTRVKTVDHRADIDDLFPIFDEGMVAVVNDAEGFHGLITRVDVLNHLRTRQNLRKQLPKT